MFSALRDQIIDQMRELEKVPQAYESHRNSAKEMSQTLQLRLRFDMTPQQQKQLILDDLINYNESFYFGPAKAAIDATIEAIEAESAGNWELANQQFQEAYENFNHPALLFNLGKYQLESNDLNGLVSLLSYALNHSREDWYADQLHSLLNINYNYPFVTGSFGSYTYGLILTNEQGDIEELDIQPSLDGFAVPLPYKIPICLNLEPHTNSSPILEDYNYILELATTEPELTELEVKVPLFKWRTFLEQFENVMHDLSVSATPVFVYEKVFWTELQSPKYISPDIHGGMYTEPVISLLRVRMRNMNAQEFIQKFGDFMIANTGRFLRDEEVESAPEEPPVEHYIMEEYNRFYSYDEDKYATLSACLYNIDKEMVNPFQHLQNEGYRTGSIKFRKMFKSIAHILEPNDTVPPSPLTPYQNEWNQLRSRFLNQDLAQSLNEQVECILNVIQLQPVSTLQHMRVSIEILIKQIGYKVHQIPMHENPNSIVFSVNRRHGKQVINQYISEIREEANRRLHIDNSLIEANLHQVPPLSQKDALRLLGRFITVMSYFADIYQL